MRKLLCLTITLLFLRELYAQHNYDNQSVIYSDNGNIGIGTINPVSKLEVNGDISIARTNKFKFLETINGEERAYIRSTNGPGDDYNSLIFAVGTGNESMMIKYNGNVGVGTDNPDAKLAVNGDIHTQEVRVDLNGAVAPDYVFEPDYKLRTLSEIEAYIKANKHLPDIPSAAEMEENGIELKTMNLKLLQKIEELMLYTIEQQNEIETLKKENTILKKLSDELYALKARIEQLENK